MRLGTTLSLRSMETYEKTPISLPALSELVVTIQGRDYTIAGDNDGALEIRTAEGSLSVSMPSSNVALVEFVDRVEQARRRRYRNRTDS